MYRKSWIFVIAAALWLTAAAFSSNNLSTAPSAQAAGQAANSGQAAAFNQTITPGRPITPINSVTSPTKLADPAKPAVPSKTVYLTFDDGPSKLTASVLSILDRYQIKATFFVLGQQAQRSPELIRQIADAGHTIGNHSYDHDYDKLYHNFSDFWGQIKQTEEILRSITGKRPQLIRAPGGTFGHFDQTYFDLLAQAGYKVFDWDVDSGDSERKGVPAAEILKKATDTGGQDQIVLLMHDGSGHDNTVKALPQIIEYYKDKGYTFSALGPDTKPVQFPISKHLPQGRPAPSSTWIANHITMNAALFDRNLLPLEISAGGVQTALDPGEYEVENGKLYVPLRALVERLGGTADWDSANRQAKVTWGYGQLLLLPGSGTVVRGGFGIVGVNGQIEPNPPNTPNGQNGREGVEGLVAGGPEEGASIRMIDDSIWISLRSLLDGLGHPVLKVAKTDKQWEVKAS
ncbi:polysaccharide deacetylase [Paenibacillus physcomitrellae]|uniref:NodB homology domain-containing protein n=1 Tax=Paenibacillus physcomitrellae TaxID=1619311 RepID=A0ABQ1GT95_9BACL|nr:polysaccharide deacetylase [Paenibacillus physcomitrellae]GGA49874.1 hypothetical protein GCM10010917_38970 [Paenibacillus physcomitrellae]